MARRRMGLKKEQLGPGLGAVSEQPLANPEPWVVGSVPCPVVVVLCLCGQPAVRCTANLMGWSGRGYEKRKH